MRLTTRDQPGSRPVAAISELLAQTYFENENPAGRRITLPDEKRDLEIAGVPANLRYGGLKNEEESAMTVFVALSQSSPDRMTAGDPDAIQEASLQRLARYTSQGESPRPQTVLCRSRRDRLKEA